MSRLYFDDNPIIAAVRTAEELKAALASDAEIVFLLHATLSNLSRRMELARAAGCEIGAVREAVAFWSGTGILSCADRQDASRTVKADRGLIRDTLPD